VKELALRLGKFADKSGITSADKDIAAKYKQVLDAMVTAEGLKAVWSAIPLAMPAGRITQDYKAPSAVRTLSADDIALELAEAVLEA